MTRSLSSSRCLRSDRIAAVDLLGGVDESSIMVACVGNNKADRERQLGYGRGFIHVMEIYEMKHESTNNQQHRISGGTYKQTNICFKH